MNSFKDLNKNAVTKEYGKPNGFSYLLPKSGSRSQMNGFFLY